METYTRVEQQYRSDAPYPPVQAVGRNGRVGRAMLENVAGQVSEMGAVALYFYDHLQTATVPEVAQAFHEISIVEMHHLEIFGILARQCGEDPRLWQMGRGGHRYWSPGYLTYGRNLAELLRIAMAEEQQTIRNYRRQLTWMPDPNVAENLRRVIEDEERHLEIFRELRAIYVP